MTDTFWDWPNKRVQESGAALVILQDAGFEVTEFVSRNDDPPDCEGKLDGKWSAVEVTRLTHEKTRAQSQKAIKERAAGREPKKPEALYLWDRAEFLEAIQGLIERKNAIAYKGGPYDRYVLVIHTDEFYLSRAAVDQFLKGTAFRADLITDVVLGLSPAGDGYPTFRLHLNRRFR